MSIEQFTQTPENNSNGGLTSTAGFGNLDLNDIQNLNQPEASYRTICPDGTVVVHDTKSQGAVLCGKVSDAGGVNDVFGDLTIEDNGSEESTVASNTRRNDGSGGNTDERGAKLDRLLS